MHFARNDRIRIYVVELKALVLGKESCAVLDDQLADLQINSYTAPALHSVSYLRTQFL